MTNQHPITPPPELLQEWCDNTKTDYFTDMICAAQWGADQQLLEDAKWLDRNPLNEPHLRITPMGKSLKEAMRPKPPSLKEQALWELVDAYNLDQIDDSTFSFWIGATDRTSEGSWRTPSGEPLPYSNWDSDHRLPIERKAEA